MYVGNVSWTGKMSNKVFKIVLVGDGGVGKSTFLERFISGGFAQRYVPTIGVGVHPIPIHTDKGLFTLNLWDCSGQEKYGSLRDGYYIGMDAAIVMFDLTSMKSFFSTISWIVSLKRVNPTVPLVVLGSKCDIQDRKVPKEVLSLLQEHIFEISALSGYNIEKPFSVLLERLTGESISILPSEKPKKDTQKKIAEVIEILKSLLDG